MVEWRIIDQIETMPTNSYDFVLIAMINFTHDEERTIETTLFTILKHYAQVQSTKRRNRRNKILLKTRSEILPILQR